MVRSVSLLMVVSWLSQNIPELHVKHPCRNHESRKPRQRPCNWHADPFQALGQPASSTLHCNRRKHSLPLVPYCLTVTAQVDRVQVGIQAWERPRLRVKSISPTTNRRSEPSILPNPEPYESLHLTTVDDKGWTICIWREWHYTSLHCRWRMLTSVARRPGQGRGAAVGRWSGRPAGFGGVVVVKVNLATKRRFSLALSALVEQIIPLFTASVAKLPGAFQQRMWFYGS